MRAEDHLETYGLFFKDISDIARAIEMDCADYLIPAPKGIYVANKVEPVMTDGVLYYYYANKERVPVNDISDLKTAVYTEQDGAEVCVIPEMFMRNKRKYVSSEPILPYIGTKIVLHLIEKQIGQFIAYRAYEEETSVYDFFVGYAESPNKGRFAEFIDPMYCAIFSAFEPLCHELSDFLGNYEWHIFEIELKNTRLRINKSIDYRAYLYLKQIEIDEFEKEHRHE
jgi:hypothetical protein